jgi:hypothetical protein
MRLVGSSARRLVGEAAVEAHWYLVDQENEMMAVVHHPQPIVLTRVGDPFQPLLAEGVGAAADRPAIVAQLVRRHRHRVASGIGQEAGADTQPGLGQRGM